MDYKVFYRKYRPDSFKNIIGQEYSKNMLQNSIKNNKISHAYIFTGPRGTGKTSTAKVFAKAINCENPIDGEACGKCTSCLSFANSADVIEIDAASNNGVDEIRELINNVKIAPTNSKYKIYIIDEVHMMTTSAFNALLLTLEEPPAHVIFIMATTNIESVPITILSRCQRFDFKKFTLEELQHQIHYVCEQENIEISDDAALEIAYISEGGMRDALSLLDQLSSSTKSITIENILSSYGSISNIFIKKLVNNLLENDIFAITKQFENLKSGSTDYKIFIKKFIQELVEYAVRLKSEYVKSSLNYNQIKDLIFELNECMNRTNININPFVLIELVILNYVNVSHETIIDKSDYKHELSDIKDSDNASILTETSVVQERQVGEIIEKLKKIRVNNCFCGAKKEYLQELKVKWSDLSSSPIPDDILNLLIDSDIAVASSSYAIIISNLESTVSLINRRIDEVTDYLCEYFDTELRFVALTEAEWSQEKKIYIENLHNGYVYQMKEEVELKFHEKEESDSNIEKIAQDVFNRDKIEIV